MNPVYTEWVTYSANKANPNGKAMLQGLSAFPGELTPLIAAVFTKDPALVNMLLTAGADPTVAIRHSGMIYSFDDGHGAFKGWMNHDSSSRPVGMFGDAYDQNKKAKITAMDVAVWLKDPVLIDLLKAKAPKLTAKYNLETLWYMAYTDNLAGFKKLVKAGAIPTSYDVAYLIHYGKKDFLSYIDAASIFPTRQKEDYVEGSFAFSLVDDTPDISVVSAYLDKNVDLSKSDISAFSKGFQALPVNWDKIRMWKTQNLFANPKDNANWGFEELVTGFSHQPQVTKAFEIAFYAPGMDGYYRSWDQRGLWLQISNNGTQFDVRYEKKTENNKTGAITLLDADSKSRRLLCDFVGFGKYWVERDAVDQVGGSLDLELKTVSSDAKSTIDLKRRTKDEWETQKDPPEGGK